MQRPTCSGATAAMAQDLHTHTRTHTYTHKHARTNARTRSLTHSLTRRAIVGEIMGAYPMEADAEMRRASFACLFITKCAPITTAANRLHLPSALCLLSVAFTRTWTRAHACANAMYMCRLLNAACQHISPHHEKTPALTATHRRALITVVASLAAVFGFDPPCVHRLPLDMLHK